MVINEISIPRYSCRMCKIFLDEGNFAYAIDKRDGNPVIFCNGCREDGEKFREGKITEEQFKNSVYKRSEDARKRTFTEAMEAVKQGWIVEMVQGKASKTADSVSCCKLLNWFEDSDEEKKVQQLSSFLFILENLKGKNKLCSNCSTFRDNLQKKLAKK